MNKIITNDLGPLGIRSIINFSIILIVLAITVSLIWRYTKNTFSTFYTQDGQCAPDNYYEYKDPNIHPDCK